MRPGRAASRRPQRPQRPHLGRQDSDLAERIELKRQMRRSERNNVEDEDTEDEEDPVGFGRRKFSKRDIRKQADDDDDEDGACRVFTVAAAVQRTRAKWHSSVLLACQLW